VVRYGDRQPDHQWVNVAAVATVLKAPAQR
jgi:hypothetical protein